MNRIFGKKKPEAPAVNIADVHGRVEGRVDNLDTKIDKLEQELKKYKEQMTKARGPALASIKQRALQTLKRKKMYEQQRDSLSAQSFNIEQATFAIETAKDSLDTVSAMKTATAQLKAEHKKFNFEELENTQDDMADLLEDMNEIQDILGRSYGIGQDIDESELEAELEGLEDEWAMEEAAAPVDATPSYLAQDLPAAPTTATDRKEQRNPMVDEYGLPLAPVAMH
ncbi:hypothetical protein SPRG_16177 [Saprolegnia parasitica CBS 223.65]|uniref:Charged multivesicular body protein 5 n=1 Tax=Saprolegnia parasitica (strain CBS 223.65) TaxID=695850 RepID=A0A067BW22_SAPPC|nr:hypothetical protein SPRG_16177 [Saprolegnia parasitica CBS 223.65]KDO18501.1 hypothetical protein SPRG_16177 [Saprolegnia parasitica CBS 223.65]|eukprot:XP_012210796.1 hypothetical protein SPRG_16177 [Saprolegnia parasitica CBS 223.65]